jgi:hypothetical protein
MQLQLLHQVNLACHYWIYYEPLDNADDGNEKHYAFTVSFPLSTPVVSFSSTVQIQTFDPKCTNLQDSTDLCEGVLIPDIRPHPGAPGSPNHESFGTQDIAIDFGKDANQHLCLILM